MASEQGTTLLRQAAAGVDVQAYLAFLAQDEQDRTADVAVWISNLQPEARREVYAQIRQLMPQEESCTRPNLAYARALVADLLLQQVEDVLRSPTRVQLVGINVHDEGQQNMDCQCFLVPADMVSAEDDAMLDNLSQLPFMHFEELEPDMADDGHDQALGTTADTDRFLSMIGHCSDFPRHGDVRDRWKPFFSKRDRQVEWRPYDGFDWQNMDAALDHGISYDSSPGCAAGRLPTYVIRYIHAEMPGFVDFEAIVDLFAT